MLGVKKHTFHFIPDTLYGPSMRRRFDVQTTSSYNRCNKDVETTCRPPWISVPSLTTKHQLVWAFEEAFKKRLSNQKAKIMWTSELMKIVFYFYFTVNLSRKLYLNLFMCHYLIYRTLTKTLFFLWSRTPRRTICNTLS